MQFTCQCNFPLMLTSDMGSFVMAENVETLAGE